MPACRPCCHPNRRELDIQLVDGRPYRAIAAAFGVSIGALSRHKAHIREMMMEARASERSERGSDLLSRVQKLVGEAESILAGAKGEKNFTAACAAVGSITRLLELFAKLTGELQSASNGSIHLNVSRVTNNTIINLDNDADFARLIGEATNGFSVAELMRLKTIAESTSVQPACNALPNSLNLQQ